MPTRTELALLDRWQRDFPMVSRPFAVVADSVGVKEGTAIGLLDGLRQRRMISRIGAVVKPHTVGASTLAAMRVAPERLDEVAEIVSRERYVSHNYQRTNDINLWFVVAGPHGQAVAATLASVARRTGLSVFDLPLRRAYHLDLGFPLDGAATIRAARPQADAGFEPDAADRELLAAIEDGLPLVPRPYLTVARRLGVGEASVIARLRRLAANGVVTRFGCIVRHRAFGYAANAMAVWDAPDEAADAIAAVLIRNPRVTLCYRRARGLPEWPYNLYCMVHARSREDAGMVIADLNRAAAVADLPQTVLFSTRCFKQRGAVFSEPRRRVQ